MWSCLSLNVWYLLESAYCDYPTVWVSPVSLLSLFLSWISLFPHTCLFFCFTFPFHHRLSLFFPPLRNWPVNFSWYDQQQFTKSGVTQPTRLLAHQKSWQPEQGSEQRKEKCSPGFTTTQRALDVTLDTICQRGKRHVMKDKLTQRTASPRAMYNLCFTVMRA